MRTMTKLAGLVALSAALAGCHHEHRMRLGGCPPIQAGAAPSGCQVPGATHYRIEPGSTRVSQIADRKSARELNRSIRDGIDSAGTSAGNGDGKGK